MDLKNLTPGEYTLLSRYTAQTQFYNKGISAIDQAETMALFTGGTYVVIREVDNRIIDTVYGDLTW